MQASVCVCVCVCVCVICVQRSDESTNQSLWYVYQVRMKASSPVRTFFLFNRIALKMASEMEYLLEIIACNCSAVQRISAFLRPCFCLKKIFMSKRFS